MPLAHRRTTWLGLALVACMLEGAALYFQYGLDLDPCVLCVYQRAAVLGMLLSALIVMMAPRMLMLRWIGYLGWGLAAGWCLQLALELSGMQIGWIEPSLSCDVNARFPDWLKLDQWLPTLFRPTGFCGDIQWSFLALSIPQWMAILMLLLLLLLILLVVNDLRERRSPDP
ncbi:MAG: disulfide bond formation protein DsbB [Candidatus Thiodiazotropha sp.]